MSDQTKALGVNPMTDATEPHLDDVAVEIMESLFSEPDHLWDAEYLVCIQHKAHEGNDGIRNVESFKTLESATSYVNNCIKCKDSPNHFNLFIRKVRWLTMKVYSA